MENGFQIGYFGWHFGYFLMTFFGLRAKNVPGNILVIFLVPFCIPFGSLWAPFGSLLAPFWLPLTSFGSLLAPFGSLLLTLGLRFLTFGVFWRCSSSLSCTFDENLIKYHVFQSFFINFNIFKYFRRRSICR